MVPKSWVVVTHFSHLGTRWWQVRSLNGIAGEWIIVQKNVDEERKRRKHKAKQKKSQHGANPSSPALPPMEPEPHEYPTEMDGSPCMLYIHG